jgi:predicted RNA methylase
MSGVLFSDHVAGILSILCAQAGAATVYAVEASVLANIIPRVAKENNFSDVIKVCDIISKADNQTYNHSMAHIH